MRRAVGTALLAVLIGLAALVAGCGGTSHGPGVATAGGGGNGAKPTPSASVDPEVQQRQFTQCMRDHGVDLPDPDPNGGPVTIEKSAGPGDDDMNKVDAAMKECQKYLPAGNVGKPDPKQLEEARQYAKCMRDHGVDMPDPDPNGGGSFGIQKGTGQGQINPDDATFKAATQACKDKLPKGAELHVNGGGE
jgi:hypothetical protein